MTYPFHSDPVAGPDPDGPEQSDASAHRVEAAEPAVGEASTGDQRVDAAMGRLAAMAGRPAAERVGEYEAVHRALQDTLATVDEA